MNATRRVTHVLNPIAKYMVRLGRGSSGGEEQRETEEDRRGERGRDYTEGAEGD